MRFNAKVTGTLLVAAFTLAGAASIGAQAQAKPNFSGVWTMVPEKSDFTQIPGPAKMTRTITHTEPVLKFVTLQSGGPNGDTTINATFSTDGKPQNNVVNGGPMTTIGKWEGSTLVLASMLSADGASIAIEDRYTLSDAGKTLTLLRKAVTPEGSASAKVVFAKK